MKEVKFVCAIACIYMNGKVVNMREHAHMQRNLHPTTYVFLSSMRACLCCMKEVKFVGAFACIHEWEGRQHALTHTYAMQSTPHHIRVFELNAVLEQGAATKHVQA